MTDPCGFERENFFPFEKTPPVHPSDLFEAINNASQYKSTMKTYVALLVLTLSLGALARADEIEFATLPQPIQTTVIRETHIPSASAVTGVIRQDGGIYAVTVRQDEGTRVVYVNESGTIVQAPGSTVTTTTTEPTEQQVITYEEVQQDLPRYQLIKKDHDKEIYLDRQTGKKVKVERKD